MQDKKLIIAISIILAIITCLTITHLYIAIGLLLILILIIVYREELIIILILLSLLTITGRSITDIRPIVNITAIAITFIVFLKLYDFNFRNIPKIPPLILKLAVLVFATIVLSSIFSSNVSESFLACIRTLIFGFVCYLFYAIIHKINNVYLFVYAILLSVLVLSISIFVQILKSGFTIFILEGELARYAGVYENPNYVGVIVIMITSFVISAFFNEKNTSGWYNSVLILLLVLNLFLLFIVDSRASILALFVSASFILININKRLYFKVLITIIILFVFLYMIPQFQELVDVALRVNRLNNRMYLWQAGVDVVWDYPIFGVGPDMFNKVIYNYWPSSAFSFHGSSVLQGKPSPHNFFLLLFSENGILGLITSVGIFIVLLYYCFRAIKLSKSKNNTEYYLVSITITGIVLGVFVRAFFEVTGVFSYGYITRDLPLWLLVCTVLFINVRLTADREKSQQIIIPNT